MTVRRVRPVRGWSPTRWALLAAALVALGVGRPALAEPGPTDERTLLFVGAFSSNLVYVFDAEDHALVRKIPLQAKGACCTYVSPDQRTVYVVGGASPKVSAIDTQTLEVRQVTTIPGTIGDRGSQLPDDGKTFWVDTLPEGNISAIDTATGRVTRTFDGVGLQFENSRDGKWIYVVDRDDEDPLRSSLFIRSAQDGSVVGKLPLPHGPGILVKVAPDGETIYLLGNADLPSGLLSVDRSWIEVVDVRSPQQPRLIRSIQAGPLVATGDITPDGKRLWVPSTGDGSIVVVDLATNRVVRTLETDRQVCGVGFSGDDAYVIAETSPVRLPPSYVGAFAYGCNNVVPGALLAPTYGSRSRPLLDTPSEMLVYDWRRGTPRDEPPIPLPSIAYYVSSVRVPAG